MSGKSIMSYSDKSKDSAVCIADCDCFPFDLASMVLDLSSGECSRSEAGRISPTFTELITPPGAVGIPGLVSFASSDCTSST